MDIEHRTGIEPSNRRKFTKKFLETIKPFKDKRRYIYDKKVPGLRVQVTPAGTKTFQFYRWHNGKPLLLSIGKFPGKTVEQAQKNALKLLGEIAQGKNPAEEKRRREVEGVYLKDAVAAYLKTRDLKDSTRADVLKSMRWGLPDWQKKNLTSITPDMVERRYRDLSERSIAFANLTMRYLRAALNFAMARYTTTDGEPILPINPVQRLTLTRAWKRLDRRLTLIKPNELDAWWRSLGCLANQTHTDFFRFVLLTGLRKSEAIGLKWSDIDLKAKVLIVEDTKARRPHALPLTDYLAEMLSERKQLTEGQAVFANNQGRVVSNFRYSIQRIEAISGVKFCIHDLRRTFATIAESLDIPAYALKRLLNHATGSDVTAGYIVVDVERLRVPMQKITDFVLKSVGEKETAPVTEINKRLNP